MSKTSMSKTSMAKTSMSKTSISKALLVIPEHMRSKLIRFNFVREFVSDFNKVAGFPNNEGGIFPPEESEIKTDPLRISKNRFKIRSAIKTVQDLLMFLATAAAANGV